MTTTEATPTITAPVSTSAVQARPRTLSIIALVLGIASIVTGQTFFVPAAAIVLGVLGYRQEPTGRALAVWAIVLAAVAMVGWLLITIVGLAFAAPFLFFASV